MKKRRLIPIKNKKCGFLGGITALSLLTAGAVYVQIKESQNSFVQAHPISTIMLDPSGYNYKVHTDDSLINEQALTSLTPVFDDYKQDIAINLSTKKEIVSAFSSKAADSANMIHRLSDGRSLVLVTSLSEVMKGEASRVTRTVILMSEKGEILDSKNLATGGATNTSSTASNAVLGDYVGQGIVPILDETGDFYSCLYNGFSNTDKNVLSRKVSFKVNGNQLTNFTWENVNDDSIVGADITFRTELYGDHSGDMYGFGEAYDLTQGNPLWKWNGSRFQFIKRLEFPDIGNYETPQLGVVKKQLRSVGVNNATGGYYGQVLVTSIGYGHDSQWISFWNDNGSIKHRIYAGTTNTSTGLRITQVLEASDDQTIYLSKYYHNKVELVKIDLTLGYTEEVLFTLPAGSSVSLSRKGTNQYMIYGVNTTGTSDIPSQPNSMFLGYLNSTYQILGIQDMEYGTGTLAIGQMLVSNEQIIFAGGGSTRDFTTTTPPTGWQDTPAGWVNTPTNAIFGVLTSVDDYAPAIFAEKAANVIDITDTANLESHLLSLVSVTDTYDFSPTSISGQKSMKWLRNRINRIPQSLVYDASDNLVSPDPIEWDTLGVDQTKTGPQQVTYFVTDSQAGQSVTSTWINKRTPETVIKNDYALDAQNFAIAWSDIAADITVANDFKKLAKTMAWDMDSHVVDEDGAAGIFDAKILVDTVQLAALQTAATTKDAKPYPVDVTYDPYGDGSLLLTNRVWVFVTTKNTVVDKTNGIVIYADDYTLPIHVAKTETKQLVYDHCKVKVFNYYDTNHETTEPLTALADANTVTGLNVTNLSVITGAAGAIVVQPEIVYTSGGGTTTAKPEVTITASALFHLRQVVYANPLSELDQMVIPEEGYIDLINTATKQMDIVVPSGEESTNPSYEDFYAEVDNRGGNNKLTFEVIVPQYYEYRGYVVSNTATTHQPTALSGTGSYQYDFTSGIYEQWITVYIQPVFGTDGLPKEYSWDYQTDDFGDIKVP